MLRILTLSTLFPDATRPNFGVFVERQVQALARRDGVAVRVVAPIGRPPWPLSLARPYRKQAGLAPAEVRGGIVVDRPHFRLWPLVGAGGRPRALARAVLPLLRAIRAEFPFDVIDAEFFFPDGPAAVWLGERLGVPVSIKARGADIHHWGRAPATAGRVRDSGLAADGLLAVSAALRDDMVALGIPADRIRVHRTGVDLGRFRIGDRAAAKRALGLSGPVLLTVGALIPRKGQALVIEALTAVPQATLLIAGDGPDRAALEKLARQHGVADRVRFLGSVAHDALPALYAAADVMVLPSASEGLANAWVEALACGTPVVTTDVGGARELLTRGAAGRLVARDTTAIVAALREILLDPADPLAVRACATPFTWETNAAALHDHLAALVSRRAEAAPR